MATITTTTSTAGQVGYPHVPVMDLNVQTGELWVCFKDQSSRAAVYKSSNSGASWSFQGNFTVGGYTIERIHSARVDSAGQNLHVIVRGTVDGGTTHAILYKRIPIYSGSADTSTGFYPLLASSDINSGAECVPVYNPDGSIHVFVAVAQHASAGSGVGLYVVTIKADTSTGINLNAVGPYTIYKVSGDDSNISVSCDLEHNGDGITSSTPNIWVCWEKENHTYVVRAVWKGYKTGWQTPSSASQLSGVAPVLRDHPGIWDGKRFQIMRPNSSDNSKMDVVARNSNNTGTVTTLTSPSHPQGNLTGGQAMSYNYVTQDFRIFATGAGAAGSIYYIDYIRATATWGSWTATGWPTNTLADAWGVRRGTKTTAQYDAYTVSGASSPYTVANQTMAVNFAPTAPDWVTGAAGTVSVNGAAFDVTSSLLLDWNYHDPNASDVQAQYALSRQIGTGTVQWWRTSDSTWQTTETFNASSTTAVTLTTAQWLGAGGASDPAHTYKVATKDSSGLASSYSAALAVVPSTRVDPTVTAPTAAQILNSGVVAVTWTVTEQSQYRLKLVDTAAGATVYDTGFQTDPTPLAPSVLAYTVPVTLSDGFAGQIQLTTKNAEGLSSTTQSVSFTVDFVEPVAPVVTTLAADAANGGIDVVLTQAAATGTQPTTTTIDLWRRKRGAVATYTPANANPYFETNASDWTNSGYASAARSTAFAYSGTASLLLTPNGATNYPLVHTTAYNAITAGARYTMRAWVRSTTANRAIRVYIDWYDAGPTLLSSTTRDLTPVAGVWIYAEVTGQAPAAATQARISVGQTLIPAAGDTLYVDEAALYAANDDPGIRIVTGAASGTTYLDWRAVTGVDYEYRGYALASNGTQIYSAWRG